MEAQQRVTYDFAGERQVRYTSAVPEVGDLVTHEGALWVVRSVDYDEVGPVIRCEPPPSGV